jgi:Flp pilus assembly protein TadD
MMIPRSSKAALRASVLAVLAWLLAACQGAVDTQKASDHYATGQILMSKGQYDAALSELSKAVASDPNLSVAHTAMGDVYLKKENFELARRSYENACLANPYAFKPHYNLGVIYQRLADAEKAVTQMQDRLGKAVRAYLRAIIIKGNDYDSNLNLAVCYFQMGKFAQAEQYCKAAMELDPKNPAAYNNLGVICDSQNRTYDACRYYKESLELNSHQPRILLNLGQTYIKQERYRHALHTFELATREMPGDAAPWEQKAACHVNLGELDTALEAYRKAVELNGKSASAYRGMGVVYMNLFIRDRSKTDLRDKAIEAWSTSLEYQSNQDDLRKLIEKYQPKTEAPKL